MAERNQIAESYITLRAKLDALRSDLEQAKAEVEKASEEIEQIKIEPQVDTSEVDAIKPKMDEASDAVERTNGRLDSARLGFTRMTSAITSAIGAVTFWVGILVTAVTILERLTGQSDKARLALEKIDDAVRPLERMDARLTPTQKAIEGVRDAAANAYKTIDKEAANSAMKQEQYLRVRIALAEAEKQIYRDMERAAALSAQNQFDAFSNELDTFLRSQSQTDIDKITAPFDALLEKITDVQVALLNRGQSGSEQYAETLRQIDQINAARLAAIDRFNAERERKERETFQSFAESLIGGAFDDYAEAVTKRANLLRDAYSDAIDDISAKLRELTGVGVGGVETLTDRINAFQSTRGGVVVDRSSEQAANSLTEINRRLGGLLNQFRPPPRVEG